MKIWNRFFFRDKYPKTCGAILKRGLYTKDISRNPKAGLQLSVSGNWKTTSLSLRIWKTTRNQGSVHSGLSVSFQGLFFLSQLSMLLSLPGLPHGWENFPAEGPEEEADNSNTFKSILRKLRLTHEAPVLAGGEIPWMSSPLRSRS